MKESCVSAFARVARWFALAAVALGLGASTLYAQGTGKIEGRIRDQAGAPIASAQVIIVGTAFFATANAQGYYFINNVPAGSVSLKSQFVGYKPTEVTGLKVLADQTITQDFALEQTPVEITEVTVTAAANVLVPRDAVTSKPRVDGAYTQKLPIDQIGNVLALQPGVVANTAGGGLSIRGGRSDENATYIDGVPVNSGVRGGMFVGVGGTSVAVPVNGFEEATVTTGGQGAEFGNAQSGIIAIQTRGGGDKLSGGLSYETDQAGGKNHSLGYNAVQASLGGPLYKGLRWFVSGRLEGQQSTPSGIDGQKSPMFISAGIDTVLKVPSKIGDPAADTTLVNVDKFAVYRGTCDMFSSSTNPGIANNYGFSCQGDKQPVSGSSIYQLQGKLSYSYGTGSRVSLTGLRSQNQSRAVNLTNGVINYNDLYNTQNLNANRNWHNTYILSWTQNLAKSAEKALAVEFDVSYQQDREIQGPMTRDGEASTRDPSLGFMIKPIKFLFDFDNFPLDQALIDNFRKDTPGTRRSPFDLENSAQYQLVDQYRNNAYGVTGFDESGGPTGRLSLYRENRWYAKGGLDWQVDRYNRLKLGGEYTHYDISSFSSGLTSQAFSDAYMEKPIRYDGFAEDRLDLGDVVVVGGLRYDYYNSNASRPFGLDPNGNPVYFPRVSSMPGFDPTNPTALYRADKSHTYFSPHVQVSFPVTDRTNFRLSYAHQVEAPDFALILGGINTDLQVTNTNHVYGTDLDFGKTITFEFGIRHAFSDDMVLDVSAYNKDILSNAAGRLVSLYDPARNANQDIRLITNQDFGNVRGIDVAFDRRFGELFNGRVTYTFEEAKNTGSDPFTYINFGSRILNAISGGNQPPPQGILPTNNSRPHNLAGQLALNFPNKWHNGTGIGAVLQNAGVFAVFRYASGTPYTSCQPNTGSQDVLSGTVCNGNKFAGDINGSRLPAFKQLDMRFTKGFNIRGVDLTAYADVRNILNLKNILTVFTTTNDVTNQVSLDINRSGDIDAYRLEAQANGVFLPDSSIDLSFGGAADPRTGCGNWTDDQAQPRGPNCVYMIRAEERFGNGDHIFTRAEQLRASDALYYVFDGIQAFTASPRRIRLGLELNF